MKIKQPLGARVVIQPDPVKEKTEAGIIIPETAKIKGNMGTVVAVGPGNNIEPMDLKVGDHVLYGPNSGIDIDGLILIQQRDVYAVLED